MLVNQTRISVIAKDKFDKVYGSTRTHSEKLYSIFLLSEFVWCGNHRIRY